MSTISNEEFAKQVMLLAQPQHPFRPISYYDRDGDCIEFISKPDEFRAERIDELVTVYYSQDTGELIGSLLKNVSQFIAKMSEQMPGFMIEIHDGDTKLVHLLRAKLWTTRTGPTEITKLVYQKLIYIAEANDARVAELCLS